jgi:SpoVK/Ycf46/Vps4 family AAA+-type ATPase
MLQLLRKTLRNPPPSLVEQPELLEAITAVTNDTLPPSMPLRAIQEAGAEVGQRRARAVSESPLAIPQQADIREAFRAPIRMPELPEYLSLDTGGSKDRPILSSHADSALEEIVGEHSSSYLSTLGISPTRTLLLTGEPGTGKTMAARWIAAALQRDLYTVDLGALMSHELGRSALNLQIAMRTAASDSAILFIDELDAVAKSRGDSSDVGEARRLVNVFLLELDQWPEGHLLIGATNHPELLDRAVGRRFERRVNLSTPDVKTRQEIIKRIYPHWSSSEVQVLAEATPTATGSDLYSISLRARRRAASRSTSLPGLGDAITSLHTLPNVTKDQRDRIIRALRAQDLSTRAIASIVGVTHPTVAAVLRDVGNDEL